MSTETLARPRLRKVLLPIKGKLIMLISFMLLVSLSVYAYYALDHFKKDKSAYIYETALSQSAATSALISQELTNVRQTMSLLGDAFNQPSKNTELIKKLFDLNSNIIHFKVIDGASNEILFSLKDANFVKSNSLGKDFYKQLDKNNSLPLKALIKEKFMIGNSIENSEQPLLWIGVYDEKFNQFQISQIAVSRLFDIIKGAKSFMTHILDTKGNLLFKTDGEFAVDPSPILVGPLKGVKKINEHIVAFEKNPTLKLITISSIDNKTAFSAAEFVISRSIYFALFLLSFAIIVAVVFSRNLTSHIEILHQGIKNFTKGNFDIKIDVKSNDEIGALSDSFNFMSSEIVHYMNEMTEKIRLEKEVEVAQLVQSSFLPPSNLYLKHYKIASFYSPASECGGDWWGYLEHDNRLLVLIADATGHGVPAALLTATANSTLSFYREIIKTKPGLLDSPEEMMKIINQVVCDAGSTIQMTFFIGVLNYSDGSLKYSSASHNPPFLIRGASEYSKQNFEPLLSKQGPHLGKSLDSQYESTVAKVGSDDFLMLFTDGILECENNDKKPYGQRRFINSISSSLGEGIFKCRDQVSSDAFSFYSGVEPEDDLTYVLISASKESQEKKILEGKKIHLRTNENILNASISSVSAEIADFIIVDESKLSDIQSFINKEKTVIALSRKSNDENIVEILDKYKINHLIGSNSKNLLKEIEDIVELSLEVQEFGMEKVSSIEIDDSVKAIELANNELRKVELTGFFDSPLSYMETLSNEMISNAIYNVGDNEKTNRAIKLKLSESEKIKFSVYKKDKNIVLSVQDNFGTLEKDKVIKKLVRAVKEKRPEDKLGGAGLGFYVMYNFSNQLIFEVCEGSYTKVYCVIEDFKRYKDYRSRVTSYHFIERK